MIRPIDSSSFTEPTVKAVAVGVRPDGGAGEQASAANLEQASVAVRQATVVELGQGTRGVTDGAPGTRKGTYPRPSSPPPRSSESSSKLPAVAPAPAHPAAPAPIDTAVLANTPQDPVTLQKVMQLRETALTPPVSSANVRLFERASLAIELAQLQLAHRQSLEEPAVPATPSAATAPDAPAATPPKSET